MIPDKNRIYDGFTSLEGGVDAGRAPVLIDPNQVVSAENTTFRGGRPKPRPGFRQLTEFFSNPNHGFDTNGVEFPPDATVPSNLTAQYCYQHDVFQTILGYSPHQGEDCLMALIGGRLFKIIPLVNSAKVTEITVVDPKSPYLRAPGHAPPPPPGVHPPPPNDNFVNRQIISDASGKLTGTCVGATVEPGEPLEIFPPATNTVWYRWTGITTGTVQYFAVDQPGYIIDIFTVDPLHPDVMHLTLIASRTAPVQVFFTQMAGQLYQVRVRPGSPEFAAEFILRWRAGSPVDVSPVPVPYRNYRWSPIAYMTQADKFLVAQDGISKAIIFDGKTARRSNLEGTPDTFEVPTGTMMAYGMGRLVVIVNERDVAFGDLYGSHMDRQTDPADSIILFTERNFLAGGFDAAIPFQQGVATGIQFFPQLDTSTGNGQLLVFAERGAASFNMAIDRLLWQTSQFQILALLTTGLRGHRSISAVNEDMWFRSDDGFRSFRQARSDSWGWAHIPLSTNVEQFMGADDKELLKFASAIYFDNRIIATCSPAWNTHSSSAMQPAVRGRVFHQGMVTVDFDILSSFGTKYKPTWEGHWTIGNQFRSSLPDIKIAQLITANINGTTRAFAFGMKETRDRAGRVTYQNQLYELSFEDRDDFSGAIPWEIVTRAFDFRGGNQQTNQFTENELYDGDIWISEISQGGIAPEVPGV